MSFSSKFFRFVGFWWESLWKVSWPTWRDVFYGWMSVMLILFIGGTLVRGVDVLMKFFVKWIFGFFEVC